MAALWTWLAEWALARTRTFWVALAFGALCWVGGCACERHRPHWIINQPAESPEPPLAEVRP